MNRTRALPARLNKLAEAWIQAGCPAQSGSQWNLGSWRVVLPGHEKLFERLPNPIDRVAVTSVAQAAGENETAAEAAFVAAMVWGYGKVGYGAFRTARVLAKNATAAQTLNEVARRVRRDGGPAAFSWLANNRLNWLGVAFATKYLYFCHGTAPSAPALVLDRLVQRWLHEHTDLRVRLDWRAADYQTYVEAVVDWAGALAIAPADVEYLMFCDAAAGTAGSQWSTPAFMNAVGHVSRRTSAALPAESAALLEALDDVSDAFAALPDGAHDGGPQAIAEFDRGVQHLRRLVLARLD